MKPNPRRIAALVGALAVAGVTATGVIAGTASAAGTGTCTSSVNVRSEPSESAPIVGVCERGESTSVGSTRDGFVELPEFGGWAVAQYVTTTADSEPDTTETTGSDDDLTSSSAERSATPSTGTSDAPGEEDGTQTATDGDRTSSPSSGTDSAERSGTSTEPSSGASQAPAGDAFFGES